MYEQLVGEAWPMLNLSVRALHRPGRAKGVFEVTRTGGVWSSVLAWLCGFPAAQPRAVVELQVRAHGHETVWTRRIGTTMLVTRQWVEGGLLHERLGAVVCVLGVRAVEGGLDFESHGAARLWLGPLRVGFPRWLSPQVQGRVRPSGAADGVNVDIQIGMSMLGTLLRYRGTVRPFESREVSP